MIDWLNRMERHYAQHHPFAYTTAEAIALVLMGALFFLALVILP